jgi:hypothetical protein
MDDKVMLRNNDYFVTETTIDPKLSPEKVVSYMKKQRTTGPITVHLSQGGIQTIVVTERKKLTEAQSEEIRRILGMR